jgi:hypothetical protein
MGKNPGTMPRIRSRSSTGPLTPAALPPRVPRARLQSLTPPARATRPRARPASAAAMRPGPVRQAPQKAPIRTGTSCWQPAGFRPGPGPGAGQSVAQGAAGLAREVTGAAGQPRGTGAGRAGFRSCSRTSPHEVRLRREKVHVGPIGRFTRDCATHDAALECVRNAPKRSVRMAPVTRQTRRSFSYPRSDLNRHWGPF